MDGGRYALQVQAVSRHFGGLKALSDVSFEIDHASVSAIIGPNGAGKTTLFNVVTGLLGPTSGRVLFRGRDITGLAPHRITELGLARTFQNIRLFPSLSVLENVMVARYCRTRSGVLSSSLMLPLDRAERRDRRAVAEHWLHWAGVGHRALAMPAELPYGDRRRVEIARALATDASVVMLDEPTAGMTDTEAESLMSVIQRLRDLSKTVVLIEHNMPVVTAVSDKIVVLDFGKKVAEGPPEVIKTDPIVIEAYLGPDD